MLLAAACFAAVVGILAYRHRDDDPPRSTLATGTPLDIYRMHCASAGTAPGEHPDWRSYEIDYDPARRQFVLTVGGKRTVLPPAMIAGPIAPERDDYFMVLTQSQLGTAAGVGLVNLQAVLPMRAGLASQPLGFRMSIPHGQVLRADACTAID